MTRRFLLVAALALAGCKSKPKPAPVVATEAGVTDAAGVDAEPVTVIPETEPAQRLWTSQITDAKTFEAYSKEIGGERFAKFVVDLKTDAIYYFDVNVYAVHKDFVFTELYKRPKTKQAVRVFDRNYGPNKTEFMMCYLVHHLAQDVWTFAFWDGDLATSDHVRRAYKRMKETFVFGDKVRFRPDSNHQEGVASKTGEVPFISNDQLYKLADYQVFNKGIAVGRLRIVPPNVPEDELTFGPDELVILPRTLSDITPVAGIISETFTSPLSHVSLRAKGWKIPNAGVRGASARHAELANAMVYFEAKDAEYLLRPATPQEVKDAEARRAANKSIAIPKADLVFDELPAIEALTAADVATVGPKAANLGIILAAKIPDVAVPPGFGVPFHYSDAHLRAAGIDQQIAALLADRNAAKDASLRKQKLDAIRKAIVDAPLDPALCPNIGKALEALPADNGVFVRSSTNAEDLDEFSGAGLHDTIPNVKGLPAVCDAVKRVWASTWTQRAYEARAHAGIDQAKVYGAALIQTAVAATAAGVLATVHPTDPADERNYTINAKSGLGMAVVDGRKVPESLMVSWYNHGIRILSRSDEDTRLVFDDQGGVREVPNPNKGRPVLTNRMAIRLAVAGKRLTKLFNNDKLDIEWVYAGDTLHIVQTRPLVGL